MVLIRPSARRLLKLEHEQARSDPGNLELGDVAKRVVEGPLLDEPAPLPQPAIEVFPKRVVVPEIKIPVILLVGPVHHRVRLDVERVRVAPFGFQQPLLVHRPKGGIEVGHLSQRQPASAHQCATQERLPQSLVHGMPAIFHIFSRYVRLLPQKANHR